MENLFTWIKVLDCTRVFSGPFATRYFADYGAEVLKIETEESFDEARSFSPIMWKESWYFEVVNRGKKSLNLNLKDEKDLHIFYKLIKETDIFVENFSPNVKYRLKIDYKTLSKINPQLIYGSLNWYWEGVDKKSYDAIIQAESGFSSMNGSHYPMKNSTSVIDSFSWLSLALGITSLLYKREKTWQGDFVNIPMIASGIQLLEQNLTETSLSWKDPYLVWNWDNAIFPFWFFKTKDWSISIAIWNDSLWETFVKNIAPVLANKYRSNQKRLDNKVYLQQIIEDKFHHYFTEDLSEKLDTLGVPNSAIKTMNEILDTQEYYDKKYIVKCRNAQWKSYCVPYEFIKYDWYDIEKIRPAPEL